MINITIGKNTQDAMKILNIQSFPFTESELKTKFRELAKSNHPDKTNSDDSFMKKINAAYTHIKNLAVKDDELFLKGEEILKAEQKNEDMFELWDACKMCNGVGKTVNNVKAQEILCDRCSTNSFFPTGTIKVGCRSCNGTGRFKQARSGRIVECLSCNGKKYRYITCPTCKGKKTIIEKAYTTEVYCFKCGGSGRVKLDPFNPVIRKGAILQTVA